MKFYVRSFEFELVVSGAHIESPMDAACEAFLTVFSKPHRRCQLSPITLVSERGFDYHTHNHAEDVVLDTSEVFLKAGLRWDQCNES